AASRSARRSSASPNGRQQGYKRQGNSGPDSYSPSGGGGDDAYQRSGKPRPGWESPGMGRGGAGGRRPWKGRGEYHHHINGGKEEERYGNSGRTSNNSNGRFQNSDHRSRGNFPGR
ncbi:unnamed protein product, partial [Ectocarpus sp. 12 AP-2014]